MGCMEWFTLELECWKVIGFSWLVFALKQLCRFLILSKVKLNQFWLACTCFFPLRISYMYLLQFFNWFTGLSILWFGFGFKTVNWKLPSFCTIYFLYLLLLDGRVAQDFLESNGLIINDKVTRLKTIISETWE